MLHDFLKVKALQEIFKILKCSTQQQRNTEHMHSDEAPRSVHAVRCLLFMHYVHVQHK